MTKEKVNNFFQIKLKPFSKMILTIPESWTNCRALVVQTVNYKIFTIICFKQDGAIFILNDKPLKLDHFTFLGSNISSTDDIFWNGL